MGLPSSLSLPQLAGLGSGGYHPQSHPGGGFPMGPMGSSTMGQPPMGPPSMAEYAGKEIGGQQSAGDLRQLWQMVTQVGALPSRVWSYN
jgi:hypothetical protein